MERFEQCMQELLDWKLDPKRQSHKLHGELKGFRELHLLPDLLLIYVLEDDYCTLIQIGSHWALFK